MGKILCCSTHWTYSKQFCFVTFKCKVIHLAIGHCRSYTCRTEGCEMLSSVKLLLATENWQQTWTPWKAVAIMHSAGEGSRSLVSAKFRSILTSVFSITKVDSVYSYCVCIFRKKCGEGTGIRNIERLEKVFYSEKHKMFNPISLSKD